MDETVDGLQCLDASLQVIVDLHALVHNVDSEPNGVSKTLLSARRCDVHD